MRIGIYGGSFDPIHHGHLILAEQCREQANLDEVWFVPSAFGPHKQNGAHATDRQRIEMIELAISGHASFRLSKLEIERGGISYTVETLTQITESNPDDDLFLLMGDDSLENFSTWHQPERICELAIPLVVNRPGSGEVDLTVFRQYVDESRYQLFESAAMESPNVMISSSIVREKVTHQKSIRYLTPRSVEKYIETQKLYLAK
ncbi:MAG: nicotinate-nucleotide adenylyltransferase [Mariniblastus sp.]